MISVSNKIKLVDQVFAPTGILSRHLKNYEMREEQKEMSTQVMHAYETNKILLVEAATGVGKSWAYLVPALLWAASHEGPTLLATHTIALQEQLLHKDIPFLLKALNLDLEVVLVKGMGNYFCFKKYEEACAEKDSLSPAEQKDLERLEFFSEGSSDGSLSEVRFPLAPPVWESVAADRYSCTRMQCPHYKKCFFFKARKRMSEAHILIANHHLLVVDLAAKLRADFEEEQSLFPKISKLIIDEAHHLEEIALESFSQRVDRLDLIRSIGRIYSDYQPAKSRIGLLKATLSLFRKQIPSQILVTFDLEIPNQKRVVTEGLEQLFEAIECFCEGELEREASPEGREKRWRLLEEKTKSASWEAIISVFQVVEEDWNRFLQMLTFLRKEIQSTSSEAEKEGLSAHFTFLDRIMSVLTQKMDQLGNFIQGPFREDRVRWMESSLSVMKNFTLVDATLDVANYLQTLLFSVKETSVLCSATLAANQNFSYLKQQIGLNTKELEDKVQEKVYPSLFDYEKNALFLVPQDAPFPHESSFIGYTIESIRNIIEVSNGGCFLLFTSYEFLQSCYAKIVHTKNKGSYTYLKQGDLPRQILIEKFKENKNSVLFATSSFWEGIDIAGEALRCVVLTKLPFKVPTEPLLQAMSEKLVKAGKDPFSSYSLPDACLKFKQGFGRLIRTKEDRGCVVCLDKRIMTKSYGKHFLQSLPSCPVIFKNSKEMLERMRQFYSPSSSDNSQL